MVLLKSKLSNKFEMDDLGDLKFFLNLNIHRDIGNKLNQKLFTSNILKKFDMINCKGISTPIELNLKLCKCEDKGSKIRKPYRELVGSLMYLMLGSRPDICLAVNYFSRFQDIASDEH